MNFLVATPVLDGWPRIRAAIASVAAQKAEGVAVRHVVQVSAKSSDPSGDWLRAQPGLEVRTEADTGLYDAISRGFSTTGDAAPDVLSWLNADEQLLPGALARVAEEFRRHPEADVVFGDYLLLDADGRPTAARREIPANAWLLRNGVNSVLSCATFFRRRVWEALGGFDASFSLVADKDLYLRALAAGFRFRHVRAYLGAYGNTGDNATLRDPVRALHEQARLRAKAGASCAPVRRFARALRCGLKLLHGCYGAQAVETSLFNADGESVPIRARLGTRWEDPSPEVFRRRIRPSLPRRIAFFALGLACIAARVLTAPWRHRATTLQLCNPVTLQQDEDRSPVLILEPFGMGDAIALQPLVRALCEDGRRVTVCTQAAWFPVFPPHENLRLVEALPPWAARNGSKYRGLLRRMRPFLRTLRQKAQGRVCIDPRGDVRSVLAFYLAGAARVETLTHYYTANDCLVLPGAAHRRGIVRTVPRWRLNGVFAPHLRLSAPSLSHLSEPGNPYKPGEPGVPPRIALLPETTWIGKQWAPENWEALAGAIRAAGAVPVFFRGPGDPVVCLGDSVVCLGDSVVCLGDSVVCLGACAEELSDVPSWVRALSGVSAVVAVNTGPMHVAAALGLPVVLLEGSSRQPLWEPACERHVVVSHQAEVRCAPCHQVGDCRRCGRRCMALVTPDEVLSALRGLGVL